MIREFQGIIDAIKERLPKGASTMDKEVAAELRMEINSFRQHKKRKTVPLRAVVDWCIKKNININKILKKEK